MSFPVLASTFANNILPIILLSGAGFALGKMLHIDSRSLGRVVFYIFSPVLIFDLLIQNQLKMSEAAVVIAFAFSFILMMGAVTLLLGYFLKLERPALISILITTMFANTGNYGLPLVSFAFGEQALSYAGIYFVTTTLLFYTLECCSSAGTHEYQGGSAGFVQNTNPVFSLTGYHYQYVEPPDPRARYALD
jgi:predicted permease